MMRRTLIALSGFVTLALMATVISAQEPVRVGGDIKEPKVLVKSDPVYPPIARQAKVEGQVILEATIAANGTVKDVRVLRGNALFNEAAMEAVKKWKYETTFVNGSPVDVRITTVVNFVLKEPIEFSSLLDQAKAARDAKQFSNAEGLLQRALEQVRNEASGQMLSRPATPGSTAPVRVGGAIQEPRRTKYVDPVFPAVASNVQGQVIIEATIGTDGKVKDARVLRSAPIFEQAALEAVRQWEYEPSLLNGTPVEVLITVVLNFVKK